MNYADRLENSIKTRSSFIVAGFDPRLDLIPQVFLEEAQRKSSNNEDILYNLLVNFHSTAAQVLSPHIAAVKPNLGFFEQFGMAGLRAFSSICDELRNLDLPIIADAKRGDIGSTAKAYAQAFLGTPSAFGEKLPGFNVDAVTVSPFLGFDTIQPFVEVAKSEGKGIYVLVKTSNPGSGDIQGEIGKDGDSLSEQIATWLGEHAAELEGECGYSGLGAVVGATYPEQAVRLRELMPQNLFLIPGMGAQGGTAKDAVAGFAQHSNGKGGALINLSRGLMSSFSRLDLSKDQMKEELLGKVKEFNSQIWGALG